MSATITLVLILAAADPPIRPLAGDVAPAFELPATDGRTVSLADFKGKKSVVLAFYPKAFTAG